MTLHATTRTRSVLVLLILFAAFLAAFWQTGLARAAAPLYVQGSGTVFEQAAGLNDDGDDDDDSDVEFYGLIVSMPSDTQLGTWVVGDRTFTADAATEFETEHGGFLVGGCVEVEFDSAAPTVALEIESESDYKCDGTDDDDDGSTEWRARLFGEVTALPDDPNLLGEWTVGAFSFTVTADTILDDEDEGPFAVGDMVKVYFYVEAGQTFATKIELVHSDDDDDDGDDDDEDHYRDLGHAWGEVEVLPEGNIGIWTIAGVQYTVDAATRLKPINGPLEVGARVMVKFYRADDGTLVAWEIKTTNGRGGVVDELHFKFVGFVQTVPTDSFIGEWGIGGQTFVADADTHFEEENGLLVVGAWVEVEYRLQDGQRIALEIETEEAPGSGEHNSGGQVERGGEESDQSLAAAVQPAEAPWRIGGVNYVVTTATMVNSMDSPLTLGSTAVVNSYTNAQGQLVATSITGITYISHHFLPLMRQP